MRCCFGLRLHLMPRQICKNIMAALDWIDANNKPPGLFLYLSENKAKLCQQVPGGKADVAEVLEDSEEHKGKDAKIVVPEKPAGENEKGSDAVHSEAPRPVQEPVVPTAPDAEQPPASQSANFTEPVPAALLGSMEDVPEPKEPAASPVTLPNTMKPETSAPEHKNDEGSGSSPPPLAKMPPQLPSLAELEELAQAQAKAKAAMPTKETPKSTSKAGKKVDTMIQPKLSFVSKDVPKATASKACQPQKPEAGEE